MTRFSIIWGLCLCLGMSHCTTDSAKKAASLPNTDSTGKVAVWITRGDQSQLLKKVNSIDIQKKNPGASSLLIDINFENKYQEIEGYGAALTGSSAYLINKKMTPTQRSALLKDLFDTEHGIGISYLRVTMGASDFSLEDFTYNDLPPGQTDPELKQFSVAKDKDDLLPTLKSILDLAPSLRIMATPWSAPAWMKSNGKLAGGSLKPEWYAVFANYFVKYLEAYKNEGVTIDAISVQNEPLHEAAYPSMGMSAEAQNDFIKNNLGPIFKSRGIDTKILLYDHNWDRPDYPVKILSDPQTNPYVTGSAFHAYGGNVSAMSEVHDKFPDKGLYFTEISGGRWATNFSDNLNWNMSNIFIGTANNWSKNALMWNLALDENDGPKNRGCDNCRGVVTIGSDGLVTKNVEYYAIAHMSKFVRPGAFRVESAKFPSATQLESSAFINSDGTKVFVVLNSGNERQKITIREGENQFNYNSDPNSVTTLVWR